MIIALIAAQETSSLTEMVSARTAVTIWQEKSWRTRKPLKHAKSLQQMTCANDVNHRDGPKAADDLPISVLSQDYLSFVVIGLETARPRDQFLRKIMRLRIWSLPWKCLLFWKN